MFKLIKNDRIVTDAWKTLILGVNETPLSVRLPVGPLLVPLAVWQVRRAELIHREYEHGWPLGIWLAAGEKTEAIAGDIDDFSVIAIEFDRFTASQGYTAARQLREQYGYKNELRAIVPGDDESYQQAAGFDARLVAEHKKTSLALSPSDWFNLDVIQQSKNLLFSEAVAV
jgi:uncharacterized protein (DUF934 family)